MDKDSNGDDARKKRELPNVEAEKDGTSVNGQSGKEEKTKKQRSNNDTASNNETSATRITHANCCDLETALHRVVNPDKSIEAISENTYLKFRLAHGGDASTLAALYRRIKSEATEEEIKTNTSGKENEDDEDPLELWLADGLGDEDNPPSVYAIVAHVEEPARSDTEKSKASSSPICAVALLTLAWEDNQRVLQVPWLYTDSSLPQASLISRRLWLRLSTIALMTACDSLVVEQDTNINT